MHIHTHTQSQKHTHQKDMILLGTKIVRQNKMSITCKHSNC